MRTYQVDTSNFELHAPRHIHVKYVYAHKQLQTESFEYERDNNRTSKRLYRL